MADDRIHAAADEGFGRGAEAYEAPAERARVPAQVAELAATRPDLAGRTVFAMPHTTHVLWWHNT